MMRRRDIEAELTLYDELSGILGAMKSFALVELRRVTKREEAERAAMETIGEALKAMSPALKRAPGATLDIWLLFGSVRGFCGSFNEDVVQAWRDGNGPESPTVAVGERLALLLPEGVGVEYVPGSNSAQDTPDVIAALLDVVRRLRASLPQETGLVACIRDERETRIRRLLPLAHASADRTGLPLTNEPPAVVAEKVAEHYLFHSLVGLSFRALYVENHMRLMQMENALRHLDRRTEELRLLRNRLRQEEIVEEIELMAGSMKKERYPGNDSRRD